MKHSPTLQRGAALFVQLILVLVAVGSLVFLLGAPHVEGRNANATAFEIYFQDPFLAYAYLGSVPFFGALYRTFGLTARFRRTGVFSLETCDDLRAIRRCALAMVGFAAFGGFFVLHYGDQDDRPAGFMMCLLVALGAGVIATVAARFVRKLQKANG